MSQVNPKRHFEAQLGYFLIFIGIVFICSIPLYFFTESEPFDNRSTLAQATITDLHINDGIFEKSYYASYQYRYGTNDDNSTMVHTRKKVRVFEEYFRKWEIGTVVDIRYLTQEPRTSQIVNAEFEAPLWQFLSLISVLLIIGFSLVGIRYKKRHQSPNKAEH